MDNASSSEKQEQNWANFRRSVVQAEEKRNQKQHQQNLKRYAKEMKLPPRLATKYINQGQNKTALADFNSVVKAWVVHWEDYHSSLPIPDKVNYSIERSEVIFHWSPTNKNDARLVDKYLSWRLGQSPETHKFNAASDDKVKTRENNDWGPFESVRNWRGGKVSPR